MGLGGQFRRRQTARKEKIAKIPKIGILEGMIVTATELANESKSILDRVAQGGETVEIQRHGKTVAVIQPRVGATRSELLRLLRGRGFKPADSEELKSAMDSASEVLGYAGCD
jgi:prevent-host-death family protein